MSRRSGLALSTLFLLVGSLHAQDALAPGARVKLRVQNIPGIERTTPTELRGTVVSTSGDTLVLQLEPGKQWRNSASPTFAVPLDAVSHVAVSHGHGPQPLKFALYGGMGGLALGLSVLSLLCGEEDVLPGPEEGDKNSCTLSDIGGILLFTAILGVGGAVGGLVVGTIIGGERWEAVPMDRWRVSLRPGTRGGVGVGLTLSF